MHKGIDCAAKLNAASARTLKAAGYEFAGRYLVPERGTLKYKALTKEEAEVISAAGMRILAVWETTADRVKGGGAAGAADGAEAAKLAGAMGIPRGAIIYFAVDYEAQTADYPEIEAYLRAAAAALPGYDVGVYGSYYVVEEMRRRNACRGFWQCVAWSYRRISEHYTVYQHTPQTLVAGVAVDINDCPDMDKAGLWSLGGEKNLTGEEIYTRLNEYLQNQPIPEWAREELQEAIDAGITDGTRPMQLIPRYQAAIMAKRAGKK